MVEIGFHPIASKVRDGLLRSQDTMRQRMVTVVDLGSAFVESPERLIVVHRDFLEDHVLLIVEVRFSKGGSHDVRENVRCSCEMFGQAVDMKRGGFIGGVRVVAPTQIVEVPIDLLS